MKWRGEVIREDILVIVAHHAHAAPALVAAGLAVAAMGALGWRMRRRGWR